MALVIGSAIEASDYNSIRDTVDAVYGTGNGSEIGYGQALSSPEKSVDDLITAQDLIDLFTDMYNARVHQIGLPAPGLSYPGLAFNPPQTGNLIGVEQAGASVSDPGVANDITAGLDDFVAAAAELLPDENLANNPSMTTTSFSSSVRSTSWNGAITHEFTLTFSSADQRRYYFNTGSDIRIAGLLASAGSSLKNNDWRTMLSSMGTIIMNSDTTLVTGSGTTSAIGNYDLTTSFQTIFTKPGTGVYSDNTYTIQASAPTTSQIRILITFNDGDIGELPAPRIDEDVSGVLYSTASVRYANGTVAVSSPGYSVVSNL
jgi:hypothetical protein